MNLVLALRAHTGGSMSRFVVRFMKDVLGENGREAEVCQGSLEIDASNEGQATELAKRKFCEAQALHHWSLHADRIQVSFRPEDSSGILGGHRALDRRAGPAPTFAAPLVWQSAPVHT